MVPLPWRSRVKDVQSIVKDHVEPCRAPSVMLFVLDRAELIPLSRHKLEGSPLWKAYMYPLKKLKVAGEVAMAYRVHSGILLAPKVQKGHRESLELMAEVK